MKLIKRPIYILVLFSGIIPGIFLGQNKTIRAFLKKPFIESYIKFDDTRKVEWSKDFEVVEIKSSLDNNIQKAYFYKSKHNIKKFSAWASISDLIAWYNESRIRKSNYAENILKCTKSENGVLNKKIAKQKSPIYWVTPLNKLSNSKISIYAGIYDGIQGSVPITHSINFYNKLMSDLSVTDSSRYVSDKEKLELLEYRRPLGDFGKIADRDICLIKEFQNIKLVIFEGNHEMLTEFALNELLE